jgi:GNAT superfamily N-acetyltransferase
MDNKQWLRTVDSQRYLISTERQLLPLDFVKAAFATDAMYWATPLSDGATRTMLEKSLTLGVYQVVGDGDKKEPIGMARMVTDYTTLAYLTDVYLQDDHRSKGLGKWIIQCCREVVLEMKHLRFMVLLTGSEQAQNLYRRELGMAVLDGDEVALSAMGARLPALTEAASVQRTADGRGATDL